MTSGVAKNLDEVPVYDLFHDEAVLVRAVRSNGKGKGKGSGSSSSLWRQEDDVTEHARDRETKYFDLATPRDTGVDSGQTPDVDPNFVKKALVEKAGKKRRLWL